MKHWLFIVCVLYLLNGYSQNKSLRNSELLSNEIRISFLKSTPGRYVGVYYGYHLNYKNKISFGANYFLNVKPDDNQGYYFKNRGYANDLFQHFGITLQFEHNIFISDKFRVDISYNIQESYLTIYEYAYIPVGYDTLGNTIYFLSNGITDQKNLMIEQSLGFSIHYNVTSRVFIEQQLAGGLFWAFGNVPGLLPGDFPFEFFVLFGLGLGFIL